MKQNACSWLNPINKFWKLYVSVIAGTSYLMLLCAGDPTKGYTLILILALLVDTLTIWDH